MKLLYKPFGIVLGVVAGLVARQLFNVIWGKIDEQEPPEPTTEQAPFRKVIAAAALQGAIFASVRAAVNRAGARAFAYLTGVWPGERRPERE